MTTPQCSIGTDWLGRFQNTREQVRQMHADKISTGYTDVGKTNTGETAGP